MHFQFGWKSIICVKYTGVQYLILWSFEDESLLLFILI